MKELTLEDVCQKITDGAHFSPKACEDGKFPMFSVKDMQEYGFSYENCKYVSDEDYQKLLNSGCVPEVGDVLVAKDGSYLKHIFVVNEKREEAILSSIAIFRPNELILSEYLLYVLKNPVMKRIISDNYVSGSALPRIVLKDFRKIKLKVPGLDIQQKVVSILGSIDKKIDLNNKLNANLEEQISVLFNKYYENAENEVTLSECCSLTSSKRVFAKDYVQEGIPFYRGKEITLKRNGQQISDLLYISEEHYETIKSKYGVPMEGDILITAVGTLGNSYLVQQEKFYFKDGNVIWLKDFNNSEENYYIYDYMQSRMFRNAIDSIRIGSTQAALTIVSLGKLKVIVPNKAKLKEYYNISKAIRNKINTNIKETEKLIEIRNTLLPKLMSGSINLSDI